MPDALRILVFAKAPEPGQVKTRLARTIGDVAAAFVYRAMTRHCIDNAEAAIPGGVEIWCSPNHRHPFFTECVAGRYMVLRDQASGDLGTRMSQAFQYTLRRSASALLLGTDVPSIDADDLRVAAVVLAAGKDAVICPTEDGGYGLIGLRRHDESIFRDIAWGTNQVMAQTRARFSALSWDWHELPQRWDVDEPQDLLRLADLPGFAAVVDSVTGSFAMR